MQVGFLWAQKNLFLLVAQKAKNANDNSRKTCRIVQYIPKLWDDNKVLRRSLHPVILQARYYIACIPAVVEENCGEALIFLTMSVNSEMRSILMTSAAIFAGRVLPALV